MAKKESIVLAGFHAISARLARSPETIRAVYADPTRRDHRMHEMRAKLSQAGIRVMDASRERLEGMAGEVPHQGIVALADELTPAMTFDDLMEAIGPQTLLLVLDEVTDPRNFGACLRVADAAGVQAVIVTRSRCATLTPAAIKASAGASETVPVVVVPNLAGALVELRDAGVRVVGAAGEATHSIYATDQKGPFAWVLGAEGDGLRRLTRERCDDLASIPLRGAVESLNVSVAAGICLFEAVRQRLEADPDLAAQPRKTIF